VKFKGISQQTRKEPCSHLFLGHSVVCICAHIYAHYSPVYAAGMLATEILILWWALLCRIDSISSWKQTPPVVRSLRFW